MATYPYKEGVPIGTSADEIAKLPGVIDYRQSGVAGVGGVIANPLPINREDGGTTPLSGPIANVSTVAKTDFSNTQGPVSLAPAPKPMGGMTDADTAALRKRFGLPDIPTIDTGAQATASGDLITAQNEQLNAFDKTPQQKQIEMELGGLQDQLSALNLSERKGSFELEKQRIAMPLITGQQSELARQAQFARADVLGQIESKQRSLGFAVEERKIASEKAGAKAGFAKDALQGFKDQQDRIDKLQQNQFTIEKAVIDYAQQLDERGRQGLSSITKAFENLTTSFEKLNPQQQQGIVNMANQFGIDPNAVIAAINAQVDSNVMTSQKDVLTTIHNLAQKYPDAGISTKDTFESAQQKVVNSTSYKAEQRRAEKLASGTTKKTDAESKKEDIKSMSGALKSVAGADGFISPDDYFRAKQAWVSEGYSAEDFNKAFSIYRNPANPEYNIQ